MEALGLPSLNTLSPHFHNQKISQLSSKTTLCQTTWELSSSSSSIQLTTSYRTRHFKRGGIRMQAENEDYELKQVKDMAAARKRWEALVRDEKVKLLTPKEAGYAIQLSNKTLLDVRPSTERQRAWVKGSTWIPIFEVDNTADPGTVSRKVTSFVMGGWWSGVPTLSYDTQFLSKVMEKFPKDTDLIVACQKGLSDDSIFYHGCGERSNLLLEQCLVWYK
ncbi:rhodanese-like domain-containing protein 11, chloroplastic isoform X2 [Cannabis sativa]|uniref:Rhodanese domain-containing protein n=1 Tax=Cannabis sativa TaxID=3483 RepID=A0A803QXG7_CANSA|nr:rhodanese-like domain-containing protein 11, chloroplastic isoform X2 [Cannabis sativa]